MIIGISVVMGNPISAPPVLGTARWAASTTRPRNGEHYPTKKQAEKAAEEMSSRYSASSTLKKEDNSQRVGLDKETMSDVMRDFRRELEIMDEVYKDSKYFTLRISANNARETLNWYHQLAFEGTPRHDKIKACVDDLEAPIKFDRSPEKTEAYLRKHIGNMRQYGLSGVRVMDGTFHKPEELLKNTPFYKRTGELPGNDVAMRHYYITDTSAVNDDEVELTMEYHGLVDYNADDLNMTARVPLYKMNCTNLNQGISEDYKWIAINERGRFLDSDEFDESEYLEVRSYADAKNELDSLEKQMKDRENELRASFKEEGRFQ